MPEAAAGVVAAVVAVAAPACCEASKPNRSTKAERVLSTQKEMRFTGSPAEGLEMEPVLGEAGASRGSRTRSVHALGAADEDVALGDVGHPVQQGRDVVDPVVDAPGSQEPP